MKKISEMNSETKFQTIQIIVSIIVIAGLCFISIWIGLLLAFLSSIGFFLTYQQGQKEKKYLIELIRISPGIQESDEIIIRYNEKISYKNGGWGSIYINSKGYYFHSQNNFVKALKLICSCKAKIIEWPAYDVAPGITIKDIKNFK